LGQVARKKCVAPSVQLKNSGPLKSVTTIQGQQLILADGFQEFQCYTRAMLPRLTLLALLSLACSSLPAQTPVKHPMNLDDFQKLQEIGSATISPKGDWIAYTLRSTNTKEDKHVSNLWMVNWAGTENIELTFGTEGAGNPHWSPDGKYLAFVSGRPGEAKGTQVWLLDRRGGEARQLTHLKQDLNDFRWSPDSKQLLLTLKEQDEPEEKEGGKPVPPKPIVIDRYHFKQDVEGYLTDKYDHLYLFDIATSRLTKLTDETTYEEHQAVWSPDGKEIAYISRQKTEGQADPDKFDNPDVFVVDAKPGSTPRRLTTFKGPDSGPLVWSANSKQIAYRQAEIPGYSIYNQDQLAVIDAAGGAPNLLAVKLDRPVSAPEFTADGSALLTVVTNDRNAYVARVPLSGGALTRVFPEGTGTDGVAQSVKARAGHTIIEWSTDSEPTALYAIEDGKLRKLTHHNEALMATLALAPTEDISAKTKDGNDVHGLLTTPVGYKAGTKAPMLLFIHGGPTYEDAHEFDEERQMFAAHGYAVLNVNYRGSNGRGLEYSHTISADWGDKEVIDLLAMVDAAVATGKIDADKMVVGGWSYGGILTDYTIASTTRFKAASSGAGMGNLLGLYGVDEYILQYDNELGPPWKNPDLYIKLSYPFFHADRIKTPTLFMGGTRDFNVPLEGGEQMYEALRSVGTPAELIVYPGQFHGFTRPSFIRDRFERWFHWYDEHLGISTATAPSK
jgi:dipeptidyl aminopeptidase/acylaminoacyl peptidase